MTCVTTSLDLYGMGVRMKVPCGGARMQQPLTCMRHVTKRHVHEVPTERAVLVKFLPLLDDLIQRLRGTCLRCSCCFRCPLCCSRRRGDIPEPLSDRSRCLALAASAAAASMPLPAESGNATPCPLKPTRFISTYGLGCVNFQTCARL